MILLFVTGIVLIIRDRGSALASTNYDTLLGMILMLFSFVRIVEFLGGSRDGHVLARTLVWLMWLLPVIILSWLLYTHRRLDVGILLSLSIAGIIGVTIYLISGSGGYNVIAPDERPGTSNGVYTWIRTDGVQQFLPVIYYILLAATLIYLTALSIRDRIYWLLVGVTVAAYIISAFFILQVIKCPLGTLGSLSTLVMLGLGVFTVLIAPG